MEKNSFLLYMCFSFLSLNAFANTVDSLPKEGNPIIKNKFTADPASLVYKNTVYLYTGHDKAPIKKNVYEMHEWLCY